MEKELRARHQLELQQEYTTSIVIDLVDYLDDEKYCQIRDKVLNYNDNLSYIVKDFVDRVTPYPLAMKYLTFMRKVLESSTAERIDLFLPMYNDIAYLKFIKNLFECFNNYDIWVIREIAEDRNIDINEKLFLL